MGAPAGWNSCSLDDSGYADKSAMHAASPETTIFCKKGQCIIPTTGGLQGNPGKVKYKALRVSPCMP
jgi:hypothetical protein